MIGPLGCHIGVVSACYTGGVVSWFSSLFVVGGIIVECFGRCIGPSNIPGCCIILGNLFRSFREIERWRCFRVD